MRLWENLRRRCLGFCAGAMQEVIRHREIALVRPDRCSCGLYACYKRGAAPADHAEAAITGSMVHKLDRPEPMGHPDPGHAGCLARRQGHLQMVVL